jgi:quercetin dioxygenase-like cupin family protein
MPKIWNRRTLLQTAPLAAASLMLAGKELAAEGTTAYGAESAAPASFQLITADQLLEAEHGVQAAPGNHTLVAVPGVRFTMVVTTEEKKAGKEFEYHEARDHIFQILEGSTTYEVGGTPQNPHQTKPGEWLAPASAGNTSLTLHKGDTLVIPRGTPHKRSTADSVTFILISPEGK